MVFLKGTVAHVLQNVGDTNLLVVAPSAGVVRPLYGMWGLAYHAG